MRIIAVLTIVIFASAEGVWACGPSVGSTFCADGWLAQPAAQRHSADQSAETQEAGDWAGETVPLAEPGEIYVEGALVIGKAPVPDEEPL